MNYFEVLVNGTQFLVKSDTKTEAVSLALAQYDTNNSENPNIDTIPLTVQCKFISDTALEAPTT